MRVLFVIKDMNNEHLGIMSIASVLKQGGHRVEIVEAEYEKVRKKLKQDNLSILAYSTPTIFADYYIRLNRKIKKEFKIFSVFGGPHPTVDPEMIEEEGVDGVCVGEGDFALLDLINNLEKNNSTNIANWWIKKDGRIFRSPTRPLIKNLDSLPFANRELFPSSSTISAITSRGCPYQCSFCTERNEFRRRSADNVIEELIKVKEKNRSKFVYFHDSSFNVSVNWLLEFSEKYRRKIGLPFWCRVRADLVTPESVQCLKDAGCYSVGMGIETGNDFLRNEILQKKISKEQIIYAAEILRKYRIKLRTSNMIGIPLSSLEDDLETLRLNIRCRPTCARASLFLLFKKTDFYNSLIKNESFNDSVLSSVDNYVYIYSCGSLSRTRSTRNLYELFSVVVVFPFLMPLVPFLIKLPLRWVYALFNLMCSDCNSYVRIWGGEILGWRHFFILLIRRLKRCLNVIDNDTKLHAVTINQINAQ